MKKCIKLFSLVITVCLIFLIGCSQSNKTNSAEDKEFFAFPEDFNAFMHMKDTKWGFIDRNGKVIIKPKFKSAMSSTDGLAFAEDGDGAGFVNKNGDWAIKKDKYDYFMGFKEDRAVWVENQKASIIDQKGKSITNEKFDKVHQFSEGLALVSENGKYGFVDKDGKFVVPCKYDCAWDFSEGLAVVESGDKFGYIDKNAKEVIKPKFSSAQSFSEGMALVNNDNKYEYIDKQGKVMLESKYSENGNFHDGLAKILDNNKIGYMNKKGDIVINPQFDKTDGTFSVDFSEGLAIVLINGKKGYIDKTGKIIIKPQFSNCTPFQNGVAWVEDVGDKSSTYGYINKKGEYIAGPGLKFASLIFSNGLCLISKDGVTCEYIDEKGKVIWKSENK